jgi:signal transduction histidine kinase
MSVLRGKTGIVLTWLILVGGYAAVSMTLHSGPRLTAFGDVALCMVLLFANTGLLVNASSSDWRRNAFWMLMGMGCGLWLIGQLLRTNLEVLHHQRILIPFSGDVIFFLHTVPLLGALALRPHTRDVDRSLRFGRVDFQLLLSWWVYLYLFVVIPWQYIAPNLRQYSISYTRIYAVENFTLVAALLYLIARTHGPWRKVYSHLAGAAAMYAFSSIVIDIAARRGVYQSGSLYDLPLVAAFVWFGVAGNIARRECPPAEPVIAFAACAESAEMPSENPWPARMAMAAALSLPVLLIWSELGSSAPAEVRRFRLMTTLVAMFIVTSLVFLRQRLVDDDRLRLLRQSKEALVNLRRVQAQYVQTEKLASLGQLAAGAAHEINNPLTAILGYSDVLAGDPASSARAREIAEKIREQARRTKGVIGKLLTFAQPQPLEVTLLDINGILGNVVELCRADLKKKNVRLELDAESHLPGVRGDANQILQVFFNIINNAVESMEDVGGGALSLRTFRHQGNVVIQFSDSGPGVREPQLAFDPFYTTKAVGKGTGLGLSICYGLVKEHKGQITCANRPEGGATFRVELPAVLALFPARSTGSAPAVTSSRLS